MTPNTGFQIALSDVNNELLFTSTAPIKMDDAIVRSLTGNTARQPARSSILMSNLQGKVAFGSITSGLSASNTGFGNVSVGVVASVQSDMVNPTVVWSYVIETQSGSPQILFVPDQNQKTGTLVLSSNVIGSHSAQVKLTANVSFNGQVLGTKDRTITLSNQVYNPAFTVSGNLSANVSGFVAQEATTQLVATSNVAGATVSFIVTPIVGTLIQANTITFTRSATAVGQDNVANYSLTSRLLAPVTGEVIAEDVKTVHVRANFLAPDLILSGTVVNNFFANSGPINSSLTLTAAHGVPTANVVWSYQTLSGDTAILDVAGDKVTANLHLDVAGFGAKKSVGRVTASLQYANGFTLNTKTLDLTLRTVAYGLNFTKAANLAIQQYTASNPTSTATATWQAGTFNWDTARISGAAALLTPSILSTSASLGTSLASLSGQARETVYRINPVLTYDGIVVANTESQTRLQATQDSYTFTITGATSNTVMGTGTVVSSLGFTANHNIPGGYVIWSKNNGSVAISNTTSSATLSIQTTSSNQQAVTLTAELYDSFDRLIETKTIPANLYAYVPGITFTGDGASYVTPPGYSNPQTAVGSITTNINALPAGASFAITAEKVSGDTLGVIVQNNSSTRKTALITATASSAGTVTAVYRARTTITWNGATYSVTSNNTTWTTTLLAGALTLNQSSQNVAEFANSVVEATATVTATRQPLGATVQWSVPPGTTVVSQNNDQIVIKISQTGYGLLAPNIVITGTLYDNGVVIDTKQITVSPRATRKNPSLMLNGPSSNTVASMFDATASIVLTPSVNPDLVSPKYQFSTNAPIGTFAVGSNNITHTLSKGGNGSASATYNVLCILRDSSNTIILDQTTKTISLTAEVLVPEITFGGANAESRTFLTPVAASTIIPGFTNPPTGTATIWTVDSTNGVGTYSSNATHFVIQASTSAIGTVQAVRTITARFVTASGNTIATRTGTFSALAQRKDPQFTFTAPANVVVNSWTTPITANANFTAAVAPELTDYQFRITPVNVAGVTYSSSNTLGTALISRTTAGNNQVITNSLVRCELIHQSVVIGDITTTCTITTNPYTFTITPSSASNTDISPGGGISEVSFVASSNHPNFSSSTLVWSTSNLIHSPARSQYDFYITSYRQIENGVNETLVVSQGGSWWDDVKNVSKTTSTSGTVTATFAPGDISPVSANATFSVTSIGEPL